MNDSTNLFTPDAALRAFRADTALPTQAQREAARRKLTARMTSPQKPSKNTNRGLRLATAFAVAAVIAVVAAIALPGRQAPVESAQAAVAGIVNEAKLQASFPQLKPNTWLRQETKGEITATAIYKRAWLDRPNKVCGTAISDGATTDGPISECTVSSTPNMPEGKVTASAPFNTLTYTGPDRLIGGGGQTQSGPPAKVRFASEDQRDFADKLAKSSGEFGNADANWAVQLWSVQALVGGRADNAQLWIKDIDKLPTSVPELETALAGTKIPIGAEKFAHPTEPGQTFHVAAGLLRLPFASPELRAALIAISAKLPGVQIDTRARDYLGRQGVGIAMDYDGRIDKLIFDRSNSALLGEKITVTEPQLCSNCLDRIDSGTYSFAYEPYIVTSHNSMDQPRSTK